MNLPPDEAPRIVRPRKPSHDYRPIIAISRDLILVESAREEVFPADELPAILKSQASSILVVQGFGRHLQRLQREYENDPLFDYRLSPIERRARPWSDGKKVEDQGVILDSLCNYVGWKARGGRASKGNPNRYHYPLDPLWFLTTSIDDINGSDESRLIKLYRWAGEVREWCLKNGLQVKASAGGLAAQLLRDSRFYPEPRRKAPRLINDIARTQLPGNYYRLRANVKQYYRAIYLDMENAHHAMATRLAFPCVNRLHAYGDWSYTGRVEDWGGNAPTSPRAFANGDSPLLERAGLHHVRISVPAMSPLHFPPPFMETPGERDVYLYSNELELVTQLGGKILCLYASYCSDETEKGLNKYAKFAIEQIRRYPAYKPWLKPVLHASYGLLAARSIPFETGYLRANGGEPSEYHMGNVSLPVQVHKRSRAVESQIVNVIHRGMIEAEVRKEALTFARFLTEVDGYNVLAIYADAIFIEDKGREVRLLPPPWRIGKHVTSLQFQSAVHFTSPQLSRLPGVPRTARERFLRSRELMAYLADRANEPRVR